MGDSTVLKNHKAKFPLRADREYIAFEEGSIRAELGTAVMMIKEACPPGEIKNLWAEVARSLEMDSHYNREQLAELQERARQLAWKYTHTSQSAWSDALLMLTAFISGGVEIMPKTTQVENRP